MPDWLNWVFDTVADVFSDPGTLAQAASEADGGAFDMGGSNGFGGTTPLPDAEVTPAPDALPLPLDSAQAAPQPAPAPPPAQPAPAPSVAAPAPTTGAFDVEGKTPSLYGKEGDAPAPAKLGVIQSAAQWFSKLSPGAQAVLAGGVVGGAGMVMQSLAQKNMLEDQRAREDRVREDRMRRTSVPAFGDGAFTPKGIIDSKRSAG